ncbi:MAG TPA: ATP-binding protein [Methylophilaceae bacterium]|nr:ATP-binding protein [Methylophilaceae bacterium]HQR60412.1 ATP-binding protein [Methylophilaceae bacterium]
MTLPEPSHPAGHPDAYWRTMRYFTLYRLVVSGILLGTYFLMSERVLRENYDNTLYLQAASAYVVFSLAAIFFTRLRLPRFNRQLTGQVIGDIGFIVLLMSAAGGVKSGLGLLLVIAIAAAALISQGRLALFYAALATIALLLEQSWRILALDESFESYSHVVMLGLSCFATAWLAHSLAQRTRQSEELASQRGIDLENQALVNQIVIRDMLDGVLIVDKDLRLRHHNAQAEAMLGGLVSDVTAPTLEGFSSEIAALFRQWLKARNDARANEVRVTAGSKELRLRFQPVGADRSQGAVIFIEDWDRVQSQARQLKLASLGRLTANVAHEIRNPLSAISHASQLLQEDRGQDVTHQRLLQIINDNVVRLDQIVKDVLQLNQRDRLQQEIIHLPDFLSEFREQFCQVENIPPEDLALDIAEDASALFDRRHLHQVLWNLCRNGWRHGRKRAGSLCLRLEQSRRKEEIVIAVKDDGDGVPDEVRPHLFEPFFTTESGGTGLGLYIARELCEANGASLGYAGSDAGGQFNIYLKKHHVQ